MSHSGSPVLGVKPDVVKLDSDEGEEVGSGEAEQWAKGSEESINTRRGCRCGRENEASIVAGAAGFEKKALDHVV